MDRLTVHDKPWDNDDEDDGVTEMDDEEEDHTAGIYDDHRDHVKISFDQDLERMKTIEEGNKRSTSSAKAKMQDIMKKLKGINDVNKGQYISAPSKEQVQTTPEDSNGDKAREKAELAGTDTKTGPGQNKYIKDISKIEKVAAAIKKAELIQKYQNEIGKLKQENEGSETARKMGQLVENYMEETAKVEAEESAIKKGQHTFIRDRLETWRSTTKDGKNFLHFLADSDLNCSQPPGGLQIFVARVIAKLSREMGATDSTKRTPLTVAIVKENDIFTRAVCNSVSNDTKRLIGEALRSECVEHRGVEHGVTCLHAAIDRGDSLRSDLTKKIIEIAPKGMFTVKDTKGRTPLHLAVEYDHCSLARAGIVAALLARGPEALDHKTSDYHGACSVYQHHVRTREESRRLEARKTPEARKFGDSDGRHGLTALPGKTANQRDKREDVANMGLKRKGESPLLFTDKPEALTKGRESIGTASTPVGEKRTDLTHLNTHLAKSSASTNSPILEKASERSGQSELERERSKIAGAERIAQEVKLAYFRNKRPQESFHFLHLQGHKDKEMWFDFGPPRSTTLRWADLKKQFGHLEFDKVLQYVKFPRLFLENEPKPNQDVRYQGRKDMVLFFEWLKSKGVERIVRVDVDDSERPCHSDEAIEEALKPFQVEILNWRRLDLCPITLARIGSNLREVHLQWSGTNAVLRSWGDKQGLCQIKTLKKIHLEHVQGLETKARTKSNLDRFEEDLKNSWPKGSLSPEVVRPEVAGLRQHHPRALTDDLPALPRHERSADPHKWMKCMTDFSESFRQIDKAFERGPDESLHPVTVALIDDGTDITHSDLKGTIFDGKSFDQNSDGWHVNPYWHSTGGHGTLMARLIHQICPSAAIHIIKLKTVATVNSPKLQIDPRSAIQAIDYATEQGADVISMSWTTKPEHDEDQLAFNAAIARANAKNVLMFCSASDQGQFKECTYPHASNPGITFCIGAAKATGGPADFVSRGKDLDFIFPGYEVTLGQEYSNMSEKELLAAAHTGSSVATALAAALAALVLECVRLGVMYTAERNNEDLDMSIRMEDLKRIRNKQAMEDAFRSIGVYSQTDGKYVEVWNVFGTEATERLKDSQGMKREQLGVIFRLAVHLIKRKL